jgi:hypothetical protein
MQTFAAPWSRLLVCTSVLGTLFCMAIIGYIAFYGRAAEFVMLAPLALILGCALFTVCGYSITPEHILVQRLFWTTRLPRQGLQSAVFEPGVMRRSLRTCANGGLYAFTGWYWTRGVGAFRAYVTHGAMTVVLRYERRRFVLSPSPPAEFVKALGF